MTELEKFRYLGVALPEAVLSYKYYGDFDGEIRAIDEYLKRDALPEALKIRLEVERTIAKGMKSEYTVTEDEAFTALCERYEGFTREELLRMMDGGMLEWRFIGGRKMLSSYYLSSLSQKQTELFARKKAPAQGVSEKVRMIHECIDEMKTKGYAKRRIRIRQELSLKKEAERIGENVRVHLPFPLECEEQTDVRLISCSHPCTIGGKGQRTVFIETELCGGDLFFVEYEYTIRMDYKCPDPALVSDAQPDFMTGEEEPHIVFTPLIRMAAREICGEETNPLLKARRIYDYVTKNLRYSYMREYLLIESIPEFALTSTVGDCGVLGLLFITLCRASGIPAGWQSGLSVYPFRVGAHDWVKYYIEPFGMLHADLSGGEDAAEKGDRIRHDHYFCNVDPFRMIANNEFMAELEPPKRFCRIDPYDNQSGEIEYNDRGVTCNEIIKAKILLGFEKED